MPPHTVQEGTYTQISMRTRYTGSGEWHLDPVHSGCGEVDFSITIRVDDHRPLSFILLSAPAHDASQKKCPYTHNAITTMV